MPKTISLQDFLANDCQLNVAFGIIEKFFCLVFHFLL